MATLPSYVEVSFDGFRIQKESGIIRTEFENGPPRQAKFKSRTMKTREAQLFIKSKANFLEFETWFAEDLAQGSLFFNMTDPVSGSTIEARFVGGVYSASPTSPTLEQWEISCQIENWSA
jgi:hypothetical protein